MKFLIKFILIIVISFYAVSIFAGPEPDTISASLYTWDDGTPDDPYDTPADGLRFPGANSATTDNPWVHSPQFIRVIFSTDEDLWGIRIFTKNEENIRQVYPKPLREGPDGRWEWERLGLTSYQYVGGVWQTGDDSVSFGGLTDPATKSNPNYRADLAWQVFKDPQPAPLAIYKHELWGWNVGSNPVWEDYLGWIYPREWAYVVDKDNKWNGESVLGGIFYPPPPEYSLKYEIISNGVSNLLHFLAQYPPMQLTNPDSREGDCDIAIYIAACFGISENGVFIGTLPAGNYSTVLYIQLIANE